MNKSLLLIALASVAGTTQTYFSDTTVAFAGTNVLSQDTLNALLVNAPKHAAFSRSAEITAFGSNQELAKAYARKMDAETALRTNDQAFGQKLVTGIATGAAAMMTVIVIGNIAEWVREYRLRCAQTEKEIELIKARLAREKAEYVLVASAA